MEEMKIKNICSAKIIYKILILFISIFLMVSVADNYKLKKDVHELIIKDLKETKDLLKNSIEEIEEFEQMDEKKLTYKRARRLYSDADNILYYMTRVSDKLHVISIGNNSLNTDEYKWNEIAYHMKDIYLSEYCNYETGFNNYITEEDIQSRYLTDLSLDVKTVYEDMLVKIEHELKNSDDFLWRKNLKELFIEFKLKTN